MYIMIYKLYKEFKICTLGISTLHKLTLLFMFHKNSKIQTSWLSTNCPVTVHWLSCDCPLIIPYMIPAQVLHRWNHSVDAQKSVVSFKVLFIYIYIYIYVYVYMYKTVRGGIYRMSQEECARLWESVPYVKLYRYSPKHLYPNLIGYGDNGQRSLKLWQLLLTYWLPNTYWNWQEYVVSVILIAARNIKVTCEWHKAIKLNYKNTRTRVMVVLRLPNTLHRPQLICYLVTSELPCAVAHTPSSLHYDV